MKNKFLIQGSITLYSHDQKKFPRFYRGGNFGKSPEPYSEEILNITSLLSLSLKVKIQLFN